MNWNIFKEIREKINYESLQKNKNILFLILAILLIEYMAFDYILAFFQYPENDKYIKRIMTVGELKKLIVISTISVNFLAALIFLGFKIMKSKIENKTKSIFYIIMTFFVLFIIIIGYMTHGEAIRILLHSDKNDVFMDFFNSTQYGMKPYSRDVIYPPLINLFYAFLGRFIVKDVPTFIYRTSQMGAMIFLIYNLFAYGLLTYALNRFIDRYMPCQAKEKVFFLSIMLLSTPFLFMMERGNSIILALSFIILFLLEYKENQSILKEGIFLGIAASIKISPILFGLLYIKDRRYRDGFICFVITMFVFNIPFLLTDGNIFILLENIHKATSYFQGSLVGADGTIRAIGCGAYVNIDKFMEMISRIYSKDLHVVTATIKLAIFLAGTYIILVKKIESWKIITLIISVMVLIPGFSAVYNLIYYIIPLIMFMGENSKNKVKYIYIGLFLGIFIPIINVNIPFLYQFFSNDIYKFRLSTALESLSSILLTISIIVESLFIKEK